ncbi:uncharacterized protein L201_007704 [Kwoniella dendrophila CBS 6074]|uniref:ubiquitinyl hydrolase 1 n=1 Tax=Kwoniella dendrophila CBS 6074 TaxID=1295534 RepID=A0AAX4K7E9_9TREE
MSRLLRGFGTPKQGSNNNNKDNNTTPNGSRPSPSHNASTYGEPPETPELTVNTTNNYGGGNYNKPIPKNNVNGLNNKDAITEKELLFGLENFGNTCYCNSVIQALYSCEVFKKFVESYPDSKPPLMALSPAPGQGDKPMSPTLNGGALLSPQLSKGGGGGNPFESPSHNNNNSSNSSMSPNSNNNNKDNNTKRSWTSLGRRPTNSGNSHGASSANLPTLSTIQQQVQQQSQQDQPSSPVLDERYLNWKAPEPNPNQSPPTVFQTIQTLFYHLTNAPPHQPLPKKENKEANGGEAQTASLLPGSPTSPENAQQQTPAAKTDQPQGPPLLASLPPPSAARGGGPWQAGKLGRGVVTPEDLLRTVKRENEMFRGIQQQDAHEFLGWLLNQIAEEIEIVDKNLKAHGKEANEGVKGPGKTFIQSLFEGTLTNETRCLSCETTSSRDELFLDLSIDIEQHTSVTHCLRQFSASEMLCQKNKFYCDSCCGLQEAEKRMKIKKLPNILALHLKRFKYQETSGRYAKLFYRVPFPTQLRLPNTSDEMENPDRLYELFSVVVHIGNGPHHGHYVTLVRSKGRWIMCDDENVEPIEDDDLFRYFGDYPSGAGYVLFYQAVDMDLASLGLKVTSPEPEAETPAQISAIADQIQTQPQPTKPELKELKEHQLIDFTEEHSTPIKSQAPPPTPPSFIQPNSFSARQQETSPVIDESPAKKKPPPPPPSRKSSNSLSQVNTPTASRRNSNPFTDGVSSPSPVQTQPDRQMGFDTTTASSSVPSPSVTPTATRRSSGIQPPIPPPSRSLSKSYSNGNVLAPTTSTPASGSTTFGGLGVNVPNTSHGSNAEGVQGIPNGSGSSIPNGQPQVQGPVPAISSPSHTTAVTNNTPSIPNNTTTSSVSSSSDQQQQQQQQRRYSTLSPPSATQSSMSSSVSSSNLNGGSILGRKSSTTGRDRTVSGSSQNSSAAGGGGGYSGGGSLGRKLSGMSGKLGRSGSMAFGKLGIGKKDKSDKIGE